MNSIHIPHMYKVLSTKLHLIQNKNRMLYYCKLVSEKDSGGFLQQESFMVLAGHWQAVTPSVPDNSGHFDRARVLRIVMKIGLKKLVECESYLYILVL